MFKLNRREFMQASTAAMMLASARLPASPGNPAQIKETEKGIEVRGSKYTWHWFQADDRVRFLDQHGLLMTKGILQPAVIVQPGADKKARKCSPGKPTGHDINDRSVTINYTGVNGNGKLAVTWRFDDEALWLDPVIYESPASENIVSLHYFAQGTGEDARPTLDNYYLILPGISESPAVSPIVTSDLGLNLTSWLGRGSSPAPGCFSNGVCPRISSAGLSEIEGEAPYPRSRSICPEHFVAASPSFPPATFSLKPAMGCTA